MRTLLGGEGPLAVSSPAARVPTAGTRARYFNFSYSARAVFKIGTSASASFQTAKKS
jgi:hypothetical protein